MNALGLRVALAAVFLTLLGSAARAEAPEGESKTANAAQRAVLATFCAPRDTHGLNCRKARAYPGGKACNVDLAGDLYTVAKGDETYVVASYASDCESHATSFGGSVLLQKSADRLKFQKYIVGTVLGMVAG